MVRYFTVVADHGHFGRAAEALYLTQPSLSRYVRRLERQLDARLLDRTPQGVRLTDAGRAFLEQSVELLGSAERAVAATRDATSPCRITIGHSTNLVVTPAVREFRDRYPGVEVRTLHLDWNEPRQALLERRVDVVIARLPFATDQLDVTALHDEPRVLLVAADHRLASHGSVQLADFADESQPRFPDPEFDAYWRMDPRPDGTSAPDGPAVETIEDNNERVAGGQVVSVAPAGVHATSRRPDLVEIPIRDVGPARWCSPHAGATRTHSSPPSAGQLARASAHRRRAGPGWSRHRHAGSPAHFDSIVPGGSGMSSSAAVASVHARSPGWSALCR